MSEPNQPEPIPPNPNPTIRLSLPDGEKPGERIGRYKLLQLIGEGGMGSVWMAEQEEPVRRRVALKVIKLGMDTKQVIGRFEAERQALALMDHPNIAKVLDAGSTDNGRPFFVMELVKGIPITRYADDNRLNTGERLKLFTDVCHAIQHAHQKGIIHRDIKPSNILVTLNDGMPTPKAIDFGIAKATGGQTLTDKTVFTALEQFIGTPAYMSPEQAEMNSLDIDTRSDIYALGVLLYELLTGKTPFDARELVAKGLDEIRRIIREEEPPRPSTRLSTLDAAEQTIVANQRHSEPPKLLGIIRGDLDWIVMKTLEKDRTRRYDTANGLAMDIQRYLNNEPIVARPQSQFYRIKKLIRRNKLPFAAAASISGIIVIAIVLYIQGVRGEQRKTKVALTEAQANFHFARKAIQQTVGTSDDRSTKDDPNASLDLFLEMYRKARATQPSDRDLLSEYVRLLGAKSRSRWLGETNFLPQGAETNLDEAIALLQGAGSQRELTAEDRFLFAQICEQRVDVWRLRNPAKQKGEQPTMPQQIAVLAERGRNLAEQLANENPGEKKYVSLWLDLMPLNDKDMPQLQTRLSVIEKLLEHHPEDIRSIRRAQYAHWILGKAATNSSQACGHFRNVLVLHARLLRLPDFRSSHLNSWSVDEGQINLLSVCSSLLRSSDTADADLTVMTNLLSAAQAVTKREGNRMSVGFDFDWVERHDFRPEGGVGDLVVALPVKIIYHLMKHHQFETAITFANEQSTDLDVLKRSDPSFGLRSGAPSRARDYVQVAAGTAAILLGRPSEAVERLETLAGSDMLKFLQQGESVDGTAPEGIPRIPAELELRHLAAAALDEAYVSIGNANQASQGLDDWIAVYERQWKQYGERAGTHRTFALCRRAAIAAAAATPDARSRAEAFGAIEQLPDYRLYGFARMLAMALGNSHSSPRRSLFAEAAIFALKKNAELGAHKGDELRSDPDFRSLAELPEFHQILALFDQASEAADKKLASQKNIDVSDSTTLGLAAARGATVQMSGRIASARKNEDGFRLSFVGAEDQFSASGSYENGAPALLGRSKDLTELVGGILVFSGTPHRHDWEGRRNFSVYLDRDKQIESFQRDPSAAASAPMDAIMAVEKISAADLGKRLRAEGKVIGIDSWSDWTQYFEIRFEGTKKEGGFTATLPAGQRANFDRRFPPRSNDLVGATIHLSGVVEVLDHKPQILISNVRQIEVLAFGNRPATMRGDDIPALVSQVGKFVSVEGRVRQVSLTAASNAANIEMDGPEGRSLLIWVPPQAYADLVTKVGQDLSAALAKNNVQVSGLLTAYGGRRSDWKDRFQITLDDASNLQIVAQTTGPK